MRKDTKNKPSFEEWYNGLSKPSKKAFRYGVLFALKTMENKEKLNKVLSTIV